MKKLFRICVLCAFVVQLSGCATAESNAYKTTAVIAQTVDSARQAWNQYVHDGKATVDQVRAVHSAYAKYQSAMAVAEAAVITYKTNHDAGALNAALQSVSAASSAVIAAVAEFSNP